MGLTGIEIYHTVTMHYGVYVDISDWDWMGPWRTRPTTTYNFT